MTAAHCQPGFLASLVAVFGEYDISGDLESKRPMSKNVKRVIVHRQYDAATFENDLALLELESPVEFDQHIGKSLISHLNLLKFRIQTKLYSATIIKTHY